MQYKQLNQKGWIHILALLLLFLGIITSVYLVGQKTNLFPKARDLKPAGPETSFSLVGPNDCVSLLCLFNLQKRALTEEEFKVQLFVRSDIDEANLFKAKITFSKYLIEVINVNTDAGFIKNWVEQTYDNNEGTISLVGGVPALGFKTEQGKDSALMVTITFRTKNIGKGTLSFTDDSIIYRNTDNLNILTVKRNLDILIGTKPSSTQPPPFQNITKYPSNPILSPAGGLEGDNIYNPFIIQIGNKTRMYYAGFDGNHDRIFLAESTDGINFTRVNNGTPVLDVGPPGSWDERHVNDPIAIKINNVYHLWYSGENSQSESALGHATSQNGIHWQKDAQNPVLRSDQNGWESGSLGAPGSAGLYGIIPGNILYDNGIFTFWYVGIEPPNNPLFNWGTTAVGVATSSDGVHWTKFSGNPVLVKDRASDTYDFNGWSTPSVIKLGDTYIMAAETQDLAKTTISLALSQNGRTWEKYLDNPILTPNPASVFEKAGSLSPSLFLNNNTLYIYYSCGSQFGNAHNRICLATGEIINRATPTSTPTPTPTPTPPAGQKGDGNKDGKIDLVDMSVLLTYFNKKGNLPPIDMNKDGIINSFDFSLLRKTLIDLGVIKGH